MDTLVDTLPFSDRHAVSRLHVIVVGAGIAGLVLGLGLCKFGHEVTILEQVREIAETGAGIQIAPNASRILNRFDILEEVIKYANVIERNSIRRYANDDELGSVPIMPAVGKEYGAPLFVIHRGDLQRVLLDAAKLRGCRILTSHRVTRIDESFSAHVQVNDSEWLEGDLVIAADGIKSAIRSQISAADNYESRAIPTGDAAYRCLIPRETMTQDQQAMELLQHNVAQKWIGPDGHIMAYPVKSNQAYNVVFLHLAEDETSTQEGKETPWTTTGDKKEMMSFYKSWSPLIQKLLSYVPEGEIKKWTLNSHPPLPSWVKGRIGLIGDACHPMLPYVAQGAANAIEDAGVIVAALTCTDNVEVALQVYELVRKDRAEKVQASAVRNRENLHLQDGPQQEKRDEAIRSANRGEGQNPDLLADKEWQNFMWGVDVMRDTIEQWDELVVKAKEEDNSRAANAGTYLGWQS
ncbi:hypothetical protein PFICI_09214 [Pestalotiopsis fici W106-1]|uniref:FAD-binding domain-containing protein n=1 Tax=Pestalotiopsis fici (strain W106-1 / CGMCC3.15140) TaxID=1229662 RepID=W3X2H6_PESFW|nr:uncharacterized protein PFICI_09214 [Pestalotiopsis fici W106-1]ETS79361.1 hypothetical protein PFICI_09214 [Pestalotiopsis fici W106-1]